MEDIYQGFNGYLLPDEEKHLHFVLTRLGFENNAIKANYIKALYKHYTNNIHAKDSYLKVLYRGLRSELAFKKSKVVYDDPSNMPTIHDASILGFIKKAAEMNLGYVSATDISSFVYCPVSYCIKKTFNELPQPSKETVIGTEMHEQSRLAIYTPGGNKNYQFTETIKQPEFYTPQNKDFFDDIRGSSINYIDHSDNPVRYFRSSKGNFVGQPDYIFANKNGENFIVEEKFKNFKSYSQTIHRNHQAQLLPYLSGLDSVSAKYGYLVYWFYTYEDGVRRVKKCVTHRFDTNHVDKTYLVGIFKSISSLNLRKPLAFDVGKLDASKCANCVVRPFCGHKTGRFSEVSVPYNKEYYTPIK